MQCEATGQSPKGRCSSLVLLISLAQHWLCLVVSHRATLCLCPKIPSAPVLRQCRTRIWAPSLGCHYVFELIVLTLGTPSSNSREVTPQVTTSVTQVQPGRTRWPCVEPQILCALYVHAPIPGVQCRLLNSLCTQQALLTWWWTSLTGTHTCSHRDMLRCDLAPPNCWSELTALTFRQPGQEQHTKQLDWYISKIYLWLDLVQWGFFL